MQISKISVSYTQKTNNTSKSNSNPLSNKYQTLRNEAVSNGTSNKSAAINFKGDYNLGSLAPKDYLKKQRQIKALACRLEKEIKRILDKISKNDITGITIQRHNPGRAQTILFTDKVKQLYYIITETDNAAATMIGYFSGRNLDFIKKIGFIKGKLNWYEECDHGVNKCPDIIGYKFRPNDNLIILENYFCKTALIEIHEGKFINDTPKIYEQNEIEDLYKPLAKQFIYPTAEEIEKFKPEQNHRPSYIELYNNAEDERQMKILQN